MERIAPTDEFAALLKSELPKAEGPECLLSNAPLTDSHICLPCGHSFNYISLLKDCTQSKLRAGPYSVDHLDLGSLRCPYCRSISKGLLTYNPSEGEEKIKGVNWPPRLARQVHACGYCRPGGKPCGAPAFIYKGLPTCASHWSRLRCYEDKYPEESISTVAAMATHTVRSLKDLLGKAGGPTKLGKAREASQSLLTRPGWPVFSPPD